MSALEWPYPDCPVGCRQLTCTHGGPCRWFALCENRATGTLGHPILGDVPICDRCRAKDEALGGPR